MNDTSIIPVPGTFHLQGITRLGTIYLADCLSEGEGGVTLVLQEMWYSVNSLWPGDAICWPRSQSTLAQVMACCLTASSHYLNQCWLIINEVQWHAPESNFTGSACEFILQHELENYTFKIIAIFPGAMSLSTSVYLESICCLQYLVETVKLQQVEESRYSNIPEKGRLRDDVITWEIFSALLAFCQGNPPVPSQMARKLWCFLWC